MQVTADVIRRYCDQKFAEEKRDSMFRQLAREDLFNDEESFGKSFFEWDADDFEKFFAELKVDSTKSRSFRQTASWSYINYLLTYYREIMDYQMQETGIFRMNPLKDKRFRSLDRKVHSDAVFSDSTFERMCAAIQGHFEYGEAEFTELIVWMFYSGFYDFSEIIELKPEDIDFENATARIGDRTVHLKDRCVELLEINHQIPEFDLYRQTNAMLPYHGSYVWFPVRMTKKTPNGENPYDYAAEIQESRTEHRIRSVISKYFVKLREETSSYISYEMIYYLGIYNFLVESCGEERTKELLTSTGNRGKTQEYNELRGYFESYCAKLKDDSVDFYRLKHSLRQFIQ